MKSITLTHFSKPNYLGSVDSIKKENVDKHTLFSFVGKNNILYNFSLYKDSENYTMYLLVPAKKDIRKIELAPTLSDSKKKIKEIMVTVGFNSEDKLLPELAQLDFTTEKEEKDTVIRMYRKADSKGNIGLLADFTYKGKLICKTIIDGYEDEGEDEIYTTIISNKVNWEYDFDFDIKLYAEEDKYGKIQYEFEDNYKDIIEEKRATITIEGKEISTFEELKRYIFS